jgi:hypothetical protein
MHAQLAEIVKDFELATERARRLESGYSNEEWLRPPAEGRWSAAECVAHLNLTSEAFVGLLKDAVQRASALRQAPPERFRRDFLGWLIWRSTRPEARMPVKTKPKFVPLVADDKSMLLAEFERLQNEQIAFVRSADGLPIHRVKIVSPFAERVSYTLYSGFTILPAHQHRHLAQAERALERQRSTAG